MFLCAVLAIVLPLSAQEEEFPGQSCTSIMVGRLASADGSVITSHTCDGRYRTWVQMDFYLHQVSQIVLLNGELLFWLKLHFSYFEHQLYLD